LQLFPLPSRFWGFADRDPKFPCAMIFPKDPLMNFNSFLRRPDSSGELQEFGTPVRRRLWLLKFLAISRMQ
jgi:hypothetical protein